MAAKRHPCAWNDITGVWREGEGLAKAVEERFHRVRREGEGLAKAVEERYHRVRREGEESAKAG